MSRRNEIMLKSVGIDYRKYENGAIGFDYEALMRDAGYSLDEVIAIQRASGVGGTPLKELKNFTRLIRASSPPGYGARIFIKDEALNDSGSFKARRASLSVYHAKKMGYAGVVTATSGNYGAAVASQAAKHGLKAIVVQECYDSRGVGQPEIIEKARACEAYGAEVVQLSVGPELFYKFLLLLEETGYFNASLYTPYSILGIETLGYEIVEDALRLTGRLPDMIICTNAGGGNLTGTARGVMRATKEKIEIVGASVNLAGLHMASDHDFNRKSFTTGHTGFGVPFMTNPDRSDVPRSAARPLRYIDRYVTVRQGEVFYITEAPSPSRESSAARPGTPRSPRPSAWREASRGQDHRRPGDGIHRAGKHHQAQLSFARSQGIDVRFGDPRTEVPGRDIVLPEEPWMIEAFDLDLDYMRRRRIENQVKGLRRITDEDLEFLTAETNAGEDFVRDILEEMKVRIGGKVS